MGNVIDAGFRRLVAVILQRASIDYLMGLPGAWEWLRSDEAAPFFDVLELCQETELKLLVQQRVRVRRGKGLKEVDQLIKKESESAQKEIKLIFREIGYNIKKYKSTKKG